MKLPLGAVLCQTLVVPLDGICSKLAQFVGDSFGLLHLPRPHSRSLLVEYVLQLDGEDFSELVVLLRPDV